MQGTYFTYGASTRSDLDPTTIQVEKNQNEKKLKFMTNGFQDLKNISKKQTLYTPSDKISEDSKFRYGQEGNIIAKRILKQEQLQFDRLNLVKGQIGQTRLESSLFLDSYQNDSRQVSFFDNDRYYRKPDIFASNMIKPNPAQYLEKWTRGGDLTRRYIVQ